MPGNIFKKLSHFLPYVFVFIASLYRPYDADLGWHLKYGEYFFKHGYTLNENTFSTMMPNFKWINIAWVTDVISYLIFNYLGFFGLTLVGALVITITFLFIAKAFKLSYWEKSIIFPFLLFVENPLNQVSFRGQLISIMLFSILLYLLRRGEEGGKKALYFIPILFLIWGNIHGQFILGLGVLALWVFLRVVDESAKVKRIDIQAHIPFVLLLIISGLVVGIHPYGLEVYSDALIHFKNEDLKYVVEYLPFSDLSNLWWNQIIIALLVSTGLLFKFFDQSLRGSIVWLGLVFILYILSLSVRRYAWSMYYLTIPFLQPVAHFFKPDSKKQTNISATVIFLILISITIVLKSPFQQFTDMSWDTYCKEYSDCSKESVLYLKKHDLTKNLFTLYNWGGWMIWNYPEVKPLIDGRMHLWRDEKGYSAFHDYYSYEQNWSDINKSSYKTVLISHGKPLYKRLLRLEEQGKWQQVYADDRASIFVRIKAAPQE